MDTASIEYWDFWSYWDHKVEQALDHSKSFHLIFPANNYLFKVNNREARKKCEICSEVTIKTPEWRHWRHSGVFIVNFEHISYLFLVFLLLTWNKQMLAGVLPVIIFSISSVTIIWNACLHPPLFFTKCLHFSRFLTWFEIRQNRDGNVFITSLLHMISLQHESYDFFCPSFAKIYML